MKKLIAWLLATAAAPAMAQHAGHDTPVAPAANAPQAEHQVPTSIVDPHAGHSIPATDPSCPPEHAAMGHCTPAAAQGEHAGHAATAGQSPESAAPPVSPPPPAAYSGPEHAAETVFGAAEMTTARAQLRKEHGAITTSKVLFDLLETRIQDVRDGYAWDGQGWYGGDINKLWMKAEGEGTFGRTPESAEVQALWSHALNPWFNLQTGIRYDIRPDPERAHLVVGIQGLAPYWFEIDGALFLSSKGDLTARFEAEYDQRITQKLILQPRVELQLAAQDVPEIGVGAGLSKAEAGLRLRYEFVPEFAPYVGINYERTFGDTADYARAHGEEAGRMSLVLGLRAWF